jgi:hypothetical protein
MTGPEHYAEAARLLDGPEPTFDSIAEYDAASADNLAAAMVHATLALVAATIDTAYPPAFESEWDAAIRGDS